MKIARLTIYALLFSLLIGCNVSNSENRSAVPRDFDFILKYGVGAKNIINTFNGTFEKDLISAGTAKTKLNFSDKELRQIYNRMQSINVLDYPTNYAPPYSDNPTPGTMQLVMPHTTYKLKITIDGNSKDINWDDINGSDSASAKDLRNLFRYIEEIIIIKEEYQKLPDAVGGYD